MSYVARLCAFQEHPASKFGNAALIPASVPFVSIPPASAPPLDPWAERNSMLRSLIIPPQWKEGLLSLSGKVPPSGVSDSRWEDILDDVDYVAANWSETAAATGWDSLNLFGCLGRLARRLDRDGLSLLLQGRKIQLIDAARAVIHVGRTTLTYRRAARPEAIPVWSL
jgi:hypothetical protein